mmetsp:Transcript_38337/g.56342  ORF Transcript_38337/g.56342 Transcript_38337/m.56342 type:complete len:271 (+) Transcript_38337:453-1265(+)
MNPASISCVAMVRVLRHSTRAQVKGERFWHLGWKAAASLPGAVACATKMRVRCEARLSLAKQPLNLVLRSVFSRQQSSNKMTKIEPPNLLLMVLKMCWTEMHFFLISSLDPASSASTGTRKFSPSIFNPCPEKLIKTTDGEESGKLEMNIFRAVSVSVFPESSSIVTVKLSFASSVCIARASFRQLASSPKCVYLLFPMVRANLGIAGSISPCNSACGTDALPFAPTCSPSSRTLRTRASRCRESTSLSSSFAISLSSKSAMSETLEIPK